MLIEFGRAVVFGAQCISDAYSLAFAVLYLNPGILIWEMGRKGLDMWRLLGAIYCNDHLSSGICWYLEFITLLKSLWRGLCLLYARLFSIGLAYPICTTSISIPYHPISPISLQ